MERPNGVYLTCHNCQHEQLVIESKCSDCGEVDQWHFAEASGGGQGVFCHGCNRGFSGSVTCVNCGAQNAYIPKLMEIRNQNESCFIATTVYGDYHHPQVQRLRSFRDERLLNYWTGRRFIEAYYKMGPHLARWIYPHPRVKRFVRVLLDKF